MFAHKYIFHVFICGWRARQKRPRRQYSHRLHEHRANEAKQICGIRSESSPGAGNAMHEKCERPLAMANIQMRTLYKMRFISFIASRAPRTRYLNEPSMAVMAVVSVLDIVVLCVGDACSLTESIRKCYFGCRRSQHEDECLINMNDSLWPAEDSLWLNWNAVNEWISVSSKAPHIHSWAGHLFQKPHRRHDSARSSKGYRKQIYI